MVELSRTTVLLVAAGGSALFLGLVVVGVVGGRRWRATSRRLAAVATRLDVPGSSEGYAAEDNLTRLERLAQDAVLRVSEAEARHIRLGGALDHVGPGVVVCDERGHPVYRNPAASALAHTAQELELTDEAVTEQLRKGLAGEHSSRTVELLGSPRRTFVVTGHPLDDGRRVVGAVAVVEDVSERRRLDLIRRSFIGNVTAELKTPVGALGLLAGAIVAEDDPALTRRLARRLEQDCLHVGRIVDDLLELSRIDTDPVAVRELVPVHVVVAQALEQARGYAAVGKVRVEAAEAPRRITVLGDRRQLVSAVRRLVENAARFSDAGGTVELGVTLEEGWVEITVRDQGPGIPAGDLERIFETFYRVDRDGSQHPGGTGLGLAIVSQVASGHGGEVVVASTEGQGSLFTLRLPAGPGSQPALVRRAG